MISTCKRPPAAGRSASARRARRGARGAAAAAAAEQRARAQQSESEERRFPGGAPAEQVARTMEFIESDLEHLFDDVGVDRANFEPDVVFADPLNKFENLEAYLLNIAFLRVAFRPDFELHALAQTGPWEFQARWTMRLAMPSFGPMRSVWDPEVAFTGVSIYGIKPETGRVATHTDYWDSLPRDAQKFFSVQAARDFLGMAGSLERTPDLETPKYTLLKRAAEYEVRRYEPYEVASTPTGSGQLVGNAAAGMSFNALAGYIFSEAKQDMTTPVFTSPEAAKDTTAGVEMQFVVEDGTAEGGVAPSNPAVTTRRLDVGCVAARRFSGVVTDGDVARETKSLLAALDADGVAHAPEDKVFCAQYNEPSTPGPARRNEVLVPLIDFSLPEKWVE